VSFKYYIYIPPLFYNWLQNSYSATPLPTLLNFRLVKVNFNFSQKWTSDRSKIICSFLEKVKFQKSELHRSTKWTSLFHKLNFKSLHVGSRKFRRKWTSSEHKVNFNFSQSELQTAPCWFMNFLEKWTSKKSELQASQSELQIYIKWTSNRSVHEFLRKSALQLVKVNFNFYKVNFRSLHVSSHFSRKCKVPKKLNFGGAQSELQVLQSELQIGPSLFSNF
jgi:hypothetical protein